ncbi:DUF4180 domain-containing protein [Nannocystis sp. SCPEA4]|uniref:DUF4180 domain-containing protein n=1 Tax=Nannocystis sp. SCPEA4 TaxID=2996787 RepID=UPI00226D77D3|nr:DUF4180 domain-containing protein [Nannocystis sp. SCPEA4]MCY1060238.1 DUF4180 domain-containing protein [Nannocystis sp. SCPEA4]
MTSSQIVQLADATLLVLADVGPVLGTADAAQLIGDALGAGADTVVVPLARLHPEFLRLRTRIAGEFAQKFVNYRLRMVVLGDLEPALADSEALRDYVRESNRGDSVWFLADQSALARRLGERSP